MTPDQYATVINSCWTLAEEGVDALHINRIASHANLPFYEVQSLFPETKYIFRALLSDIQHRVDPTLPLPETSDLSSDDLYFDAVMTYFDAVAPHKKAIYQLTHEGIKKPICFVSFLPTLQDFSNDLRNRYYPKPSSYGQLSCGVDLLHQWATQALLARVFYVWLEDDTFDLAKTMAALDQGMKTMRSYLGG